MIPSYLFVHFLGGWPMDTVQRNDLPYRWYHELPAKIVPFFEDLGVYHQ